MVEVACQKRHQLNALLETAGVKMDPKPKNRHHRAIYSRTFSPSLDDPFPIAACHCMERKRDKESGLMWRSIGGNIELGEVSSVESVESGLLLCFCLSSIFL